MPPINEINPSYNADNRVQQTRQNSQADRARHDEAEQARRDQPRQDDVTISQRTQELRRVEAQVRNQPEVREERVQQIRQQIADGTYNEPDNRQLASDILRTILGSGS